MGTNIEGRCESDGRCSLPVTLGSEKPPLGPDPTGPEILGLHKKHAFKLKLLIFSNPLLSSLPGLLSKVRDGCQLPTAVK